jgi:hypothetical protein
MSVPVLDSSKKPLMPCSEKRARKMMEKNTAKPFWVKGVFCIILQKEPSSRFTQKVIVAIDPGSKRTGVTATTEQKVTLNIQLNAPDWVKSAVKLRRTLRRSRRGRKTPYRKCRSNRKIGGIPPSTKARWQAHIRVVDVLFKLIPITDVIIEDVKAKTKKGKKSWNKSFSPLEVGKLWFENEVLKRGFRFHKFKGLETSKWRKARGFEKTSAKLKDVWEAHCVDSHCLCEMLIGNIKPFKGFYRFNFLQWSRRQIHMTNPVKGIRKAYGTTVSLGIPRGTLVVHSKYGKCYVGGSSKGRLSLHNISDIKGKRLCQNAKKEDCILLAKQIWCGGFSSPYLKEGVSDFR